MGASNKACLPSTFRDFPAGSCGESTMFLGTYLHEKQLGRFEYVLGIQGSHQHSRNDFRSHAWLQQHKLIVDITADQFAEVSQPVIVTYDSSWHSKFRQQMAHVADYRHSAGKDNFERPYQLLAQLADTFSSIP